MSLRVNAICFTPVSGGGIIPAVVVSITWFANRSLERPR